MLEYIKGVLVNSSPQKAVIDVSGIGHGFFIPLSTYSKLPKIGEEILLYIASVIREDSHRHFGFLSEEERNLFEIVLDVSGIGPKTAQKLLTQLPVSSLADLSVSKAALAALTKWLSD